MKLNGQVMMTEVFPDMYPHPAARCCRDAGSNNGGLLSMPGLLIAVAGSQTNEGRSGPALLAAGCKEGSYTTTHEWFRCSDPVGTIKILTHTWKCVDGEWVLDGTHDTGCMDAKKAEEIISGMKKGGFW